MSDEACPGLSVAGETSSRGRMFRRGLCIAGAVLITVGLAGTAISAWKLARGYTMLGAPPPFRYSDGPPHKAEMGFSASLQVQLRQIIRALWV